MSRILQGLFATSSKGRDHVSRFCITAFVLLLLSVSVFPPAMFVVAEEVASDDDVVDGIRYSWNNDNHTAAVIGNNYSGEIVIPSEVEHDSKRYKVTTIDSYAFESCKSLITVDLPIGLETIGLGAFNNCNSLRNITIPDSVKNILDSAFMDCWSITTINIPSSVINIGIGAFSGCTSLTAFDVHPENDKYCSEDGVLFDHEKTNLICYPGGKVGSYSIPVTVNELSTLSFYKSVFLDALAIPEGITAIGVNAFAYSEALVSITLPSSITQIPSGAFVACKSLTSVTIPESVKDIGYNAFSDCTSLTSIVLPSALKAINMNLFKGCSSLVSVNIPDGVTTIDREAFYGCSSIASLAIPASVETIGECAFAGCTSATIQVDSGNLYFVLDNGVLFTKDKSELVQYPASIDGTSYVVPKEVKSIRPGAFYGCKSLTSVTLHDGITAIGYEAFRECSSLTSMAIPAAVESINSRTFYGCTALGSVSIPEGVTEISFGAFYNCTSLTAITIPKSVNSISEGAFVGCTSITAFTVSEGNVSYHSDESGVLYGDDDTLVQYPSGRTEQAYGIKDGTVSIKDYAFFGCKYLTSVSIPNSVTQIGSHAFFGCSSLTSMEIPEGVESISEETFTDCSSLTSIKIPASVTFISNTSTQFSGCTSLKEFIVDKNNKHYCSENGVLYDVNKTEIICYPASKEDTSFSIPEGIMKINDATFSGNRYLTSLTIPASVTSISIDALAGCIALKEIIVSEGNGHFSSVDGYLLSKNGDTLLCCPAGNKECIIPSVVKTIGAYAITGPNVEKIVFSENDSVAMTNSIYCVENLKEIVVQNPETAFKLHSIVFDDAEHHKIIVTAPEGFTIPDNAVNGDVEFEYQDINKRGDESNVDGIVICIAIAILVIVAIGAAVFLKKKGYISK